MIDADYTVLYFSLFENPSQYSDPSSSFVYIIFIDFLNCSIFCVIIFYPIEIEFFYFSQLNFVKLRFMTNFIFFETK